MFSLMRDISLSASQLEGAIAGGDAPYTSLSSIHYVLDGKLDGRYSKIHQNLPGNFSLILTDKDEKELKIHNDHSYSDNTRIQHRGIVKTTREKANKWHKLRNTPNNFTFRVGGEIAHVYGSHYVNDTRLVVKVNESILDDASSTKNRLCGILRHMTIRNTLDVIPPNRGIPPALLIVSIDCDALYSIEGLGHLIWAVYGVKLAAALARVDVDFQCIGGGDYLDLSERQGASHELRSILPWFARYQAAAASDQPWQYSGTQPTNDQVCAELGEMPLDKMATQIRDDVRRMAVELVGSRAELGRHHHLVPLDSNPLIPNISLDGVVIHFPCEDYNVAGLESDSYDIGILHFSEYTKWISNNVESIGIVVSNSEGSPQWCRPLSHHLMGYLLKFYPSAKITIYTDDPPALQYARIAMAEQSFSSMGTFGLIPVVGTFGKGYFQPSKSDKIQHCVYNIARYDGFDNVQTMSGRSLAPEEMLSELLPQVDGP